MRARVLMAAVVVAIEFGMLERWEHEQRNGSLHARRRGSRT